MNVLNVLSIMAKPVRVILASPPQTGSTLMLNLVHGYLAPNEPRHWCTERLIDDFMITKTHRLNIEEWMTKYPQYDMYFVMTERDDEKMTRVICDADKERKNVLVVNYDDINETTALCMDTIVDDMYDRFSKFFPEEIRPSGKKRKITDNMNTRVYHMNKMVEQIKDMPFHICDEYYGVHGGHRNRPLDEVSYIFVSGADREDTDKRLEEYYRQKKERVVVSDKPLEVINN